MSRRLKYDPLAEFLNGQTKGRVASFSEVADLVGGLPNSAYEYPAWWSNGGGYSQTEASPGRGGLQNLV